MLSTSSLVGGFNDPAAKTKLIGSNNRERDLDRYAFSKVERVPLRDCSGLNKLEKRDHVTKFTQMFHERASPISLIK